MQKVHLKAPVGWINDPNGFIYYKGQYHLFYQHFPYAPRWGRMHWGHAVSNDLVSWEHYRIALFPSKTDDRDGCFSGSAIEKDGRMHLFYTGVRYDTPDPENTNCCLDDKFTAAQLHITSGDGWQFDNFDGKQTVIPPIEDKTIGDRNHTRDPKVWQGRDGRFYMVLGSTVDGEGRLLFYRSDDLECWEYAGFTKSENLGWMWECPDYFEADGKGVLIFSPMGLEAGNQTVCTFAEFDERSCSMEIGKDCRFVDYGLDLYAPQSTVDQDGRRVVAFWLRMPEPMSSGSIGMFSIPRVCEVREGHICFQPHPNVKARFVKKIRSPKEAALDGGYMLKARLEAGEGLNIGGYKITYGNGRLTADRSSVVRNHSELKNVAESPVIEKCELEIYVDENIIEIYINGGEYTITHAVYDLTGEITGANAELYTLEG